MTEPAAGPCPTCQVLERQLAQAERQLAQMERALDQAKSTIEDLQRVIYYVVIRCQDVQKQSRPVLGKRSGVPRGEWAWHKGRNDVATMLLREIGWTVTGRRV